MLLSLQECIPCECVYEYIHTYIYVYIYIYITDQHAFRKLKNDLDKRRKDKIEIHSGVCTKNLQSKSRGAVAR